jgi:hypothetical protein
MVRPAYIGLSIERAVPPFFENGIIVECVNSMLKPGNEIFGTKDACEIIMFSKGSKFGFG